MTANLTSIHKTSTIQRPIGVWILTFYALIFAGIAPLWNYIYWMASGNIPQLLGGNQTANIFLFVLCTSIIIISVISWLGKEIARNVLLALITLYYIFIGINSFLFINSSEFIPYIMQTGNKSFQFILQIKSWFPVFWGILCPAIYFWYFNRHSTKEFFNSNS